MKKSYIIIFLTAWLIGLLILTFYDFSRHDYNCSDFKTQKEALKIFVLNKLDIFHLDSDHDGKPCEELQIKSIL